MANYRILATFALVGATFVTSAVDDMRPRQTIGSTATAGNLIMGEPSEASPLSLEDSVSTKDSGKPELQSLTKLAFPDSTNLAVVSSPARSLRLRRAPSAEEVITLLGASAASLPRWRLARPMVDIDVDTFDECRTVICARKDEFNLVPIEHNFGLASVRRQTDKTAKPS